LILGTCSNWANQPVKLEHNLIFIEQLPADVSSFWQICSDQMLPNNSKTLFQCEPLSKEGLVSKPGDSIINLQLQFVLDPPLGQLYPGLVLDEIQGADELWLNGELIDKTGEFPPRYENASFYTRYYFLPPEKLQFHKTNTLVLKIYNYDSHNDLIHISSRLLPHDSLMLHVGSADLFYSFIAAILLIIAVYKIYYFVRIPGSYEALSLSSFCLLSAFFLLLNHQFTINLGFDSNSLLRWKSVSLIFSQMTLTYFLFHNFEFKKSVVKRLLISFFIFLGIILLIWPQVEYLQAFYSVAKLLALVPPTATIAMLLVTRRAPLIKTQWALFGAMIIYVMLLFADINRYFWIQWFAYRENAAFILGLSILAITSAITLTEQYWQYFKGATYDHLTGTLLKPSFLKRLSEEMQRCRRSDYCLLVAVIDIDQFKSINQNYGHDIGDKALILISATLTRVLRQFDLICRLSDDEFCVAATLPSNEDTHVFLQRLHDEINNSSVTLDNHDKLIIKATTGAVIYNMKRHHTPDMLLHDAEHSVTEAKMKQRGSIQWFDTDNPPLQFIF
jgi:diguanylate cyclase (GGDEF)-like protein